jgi:glycine cleavage system H protein
LEAAPEFLNDDPYDSGWLVIVEINDTEELNSLMSADDYMEYVAECD